MASRLCGALNGLRRRDRRTCLSALPLAGKFRSWIRRPRRYRTALPSIRLPELPRGRRLEKAWMDLLLPCTWGPRHTDFADIVRRGSQGCPALRPARRLVLLPQYSLFARTFALPRKVEISPSRKR